MKKTYFLLMFIFMLFLTSCGKEKYKDMDVVVHSMFDDSNFSINLPIIDALDGENTANFFYCKLTMDEISNKVEYYEKDGDFIRFFSSNNYYCLEFVSFDGNKKKYKLVSENILIPLPEEKDAVKIPFPRNYYNSITFNKAIDNNDMDYFISYYTKLGKPINDNNILIGKYVSAKGCYYDVEISKDEGIKLVKVND